MGGFIGCCGLFILLAEVPDLSILADRFPSTKGRLVPRRNFNGNGWGAGDPIFFKWLPSNNSQIVFFSSQSLGSQQNFGNKYSYEWQILEISEILQGPLFF